MSNLLAYANETMPNSTYAKQTVKSNNPEQPQVPDEQPSIFALRSRFIWSNKI